MLFSLESRESKGKEGKVGEERGGDGSLTQSDDLCGVEQMVPLTPAAERAALRALTPPGAECLHWGPAGAGLPHAPPPAPPPALRLLASESHCLD